MNPKLKAMVQVAALLGTALAVRFILHATGVWPFEGL